MGPFLHTGLAGVGSGFVAGIRLGAGAVGGAARIRVAVDELDHGRRGVVAAAEASLENAGVAAITI